MSAVACGALVVGSFNRKKAEELTDLMRDLKLPVRPISDFPNVRPVPEDGATFRENAALKALGMARQVVAGEILGVVADDSGLEVDALGKRPGVYSARYVSEKATDPERVRRILDELGDLPPERRTARFRCCICLADRERVLLQTEDAVEGRIAFAPAGEFGFGYDPIFIPEGYVETFAQLGAGVKHRISHRARALRKFHAELARMLCANERRHAE